MVIYTIDMTAKEFAILKDMKIDPKYYKYNKKEGIMKINDSFAYSFYEKAYRILRHLEFYGNNQADHLLINTWKRIVKAKGKVPRIGGRFEFYGKQLDGYFTSFYKDGKRGI